MLKIRILIAATAVASLSACLDNDAERGIAGAVGGAVIAEAVGGNGLAGAAIGGAAGVFCDDVGVCN